MNKDFTHQEVAIAKYLAGEATAHEQQELAVWRAAHPDNEAYLRQSERLWQAMESGVSAPISVDTEAALASVKRKIAAPQPAPLRANLTRRYLLVAASIALLVAAWWWRQPGMDNTQPQQIFATRVQTDTLPDGSRVTLNAGAQLTIEEGFGKQNRKVQLRGDAYFDVAHDSAKPYQVQTGEVLITVLGTEFHVKQQEAELQTLVQVFEGRVEVSAFGKSHQLTIGQALVIDARARTLLPIAINEQQIGFKSGRFAFDNTPLADALIALGNYHGVHFTIGQEALRNCPLTARLENRNLADLLVILEETYNCTAIQNGQEVVLKGGGCD